MKINLNIIKLFLPLFVILSVLFISNSIFTKSASAKALPPGSGIGDIPANVLILLDRSGSMSRRLISGAGVHYPWASTTDTNGDVYVAQLAGQGIKKFLYDTLLVDLNYGTGGKFSGVTTGANVCKINYLIDIKFHNGNLYVTDYYGQALYKFNVANGTCDFKKSLSFPRKIAIKNNKMYVATSGGLYARNLTTNSDINCSANVGSISRSFGIAIDSSGNNLYFHTNNGRNGLIHRHSFSGECPSTNRTSSISVNNWRVSYGIDAHPSDDSILYGSDYYNAKIYKFTLNASRNGISSTVRKGTRRNKSSTSSNLFIYYPGGIHVDTTNNRVILSDLNKSAVQFFDLDLDWIKELGGSLATRMTGAHEAIQAIVSDPALKSTVNFGFGYWSSEWRGPAKWFTGWNARQDRARPCTRNNCLRVKVNEQGADKIYKIVKSVSPRGGTDASIWARMASQYYSFGSDGNHSPILSQTGKASDCQKSYIIVIGDGAMTNVTRAKNIVTTLNGKSGNKRVKTFTIAYGGGISPSGISKFREISKAGGTEDVIIADTAASLTSQLKALISSINAPNLSFTAPAINAKINEGGFLYQASFDYYQNLEWSGSLKKIEIDPVTNLPARNADDTPKEPLWDAAKKIPSVNARKIWTVLDTIDYAPDYNNFVDTNYIEINGMFERLGNEVAAYHNRTLDSKQHPNNTLICADKVASIQDGNDDDIKGLINFVRGEDYFNYKGDCQLKKPRKRTDKKSGETIPAILGDIYHSEMIIVGAPGAETSYTSKNQEAFWRVKKGYIAWADSLKNRKEIIYVGANDGMLHAFDADTGIEEWAFIPPFIGSMLPKIVNVNFNRDKPLNGGSNAIYGVDGSVTAHDIYFKKPGTTGKGWYTILMIPYGRGGAGFSVLDITNPAKPDHLYSVFNDYVLKKVHFVDHNGNFESHDYIATFYPLASFSESIRATDNAQDSSKSKTCNSSGDTQCYEGLVWTLPVKNLNKSDLTIYLDQDPLSDSKWSFSKNSAGEAVITFKENMTYYGYEESDPLKGSSDISLEIKTSSMATGVKSRPEYDYSRLGDTWSSPRIIRIPNDGRGDLNDEDDVYVAIMGGGYAGVAAGVGSNVTIVNLEKSGEIYKTINIKDLGTDGSLNNYIRNQVPASPVVITPDLARGVPYRGAMVYINDFEGKITKINLTNMTHEEGFEGGKEINIFDSTTLFSSGSNNLNQRYMFHSMDAAIGTTTGALWMFAGTGNYERIAEKKGSNMLLGINDRHFPFYRNLPQSRTNNDLIQCKDTTNDNTGANCPKYPTFKGWYVNLTDFGKTTAEPTVGSGLVYFPIYKPHSTAACGLGNAVICAIDDECGTNNSSQLGPNDKGADANEKCKIVGIGVLSRIVVFANKLFANIAGETNTDIKDLVAIDGGVGDVNTYRNSWRSNY